MKTIKRKITDIISILFYLYFVIRPVGYGINLHEKRDKKIIVSLTSFGPRLPYVYVCIKSILVQTKKPDAVILYLDSSIKQSDVPDSLLKLEKHGLSIKYGCVDLKPHKKYFYACQEYNKDIIITVDDDVMYENTLVESLYNTYINNKNCVICKRARIIRFNENGKLIRYADFPLERNEYGNISHKYIAIGVGGKLYPPDVLPQETFNTDDINRLALYTDDLWLKSIELYNNIPVICVRPKFRFLLHIPIKGDVKLCQNNINGGMNDKCFRDILYFFFGNDYEQKVKDIIDSEKQIPDNEQ